MWHFMPPINLGFFGSDMANCLANLFPFFVSLSRSGKAACTHTEGGTHTHTHTHTFFVPNVSWLIQWIVPCKKYKTYFPKRDMPSQPEQWQPRSRQFWCSRPWFNALKTSDQRQNVPVLGGFSLDYLSFIPIKLWNRKSSPPESMISIKLTWLCNVIITRWCKCAWSIWFWSF